MRHGVPNKMVKTWLSSSRTVYNAAEKKWLRPVGYDTGIKTYNSLTKQKEPLVLARERIATW